MNYPKIEGIYQTLDKFIINNRDEIDECIRRITPNVINIDDRERELWILNDKPLYNWAYDEGVIF